MSNFKYDFDYIKINLASPKRIREWGTRMLPTGEIIGKVMKPETINYRTFKPEMDGLFCEKIFGPVKNWECHCGKYKRVEPNELLVCERCNVEVTESRVRRHRMGYIDLISPVTHVWYLKGTPSYLSILLKQTLKKLEEYIYFNQYLVFTKDSTLENIENNIENNLTFEECLVINDDNLFGESIRAKIGADAIKTLLTELNLNQEIIKDRIALGCNEHGLKFYEEIAKKILVVKKKEEKN